MECIFLSWYATQGRVLPIRIWIPAGKKATEPWFRKFFGRHHDFVDRYEISISQMTKDIFPLSWQQIHYYIGCDWHRLRLYTFFVYWVIQRVPLVEQELLALPEHLNSPLYFWVRVTLDLVFSIVLCVLCFFRFPFLFAMVLPVFWFNYFCLSLWYLRIFV